MTELICYYHVHVGSLDCMNLRGGYNCPYSKDTERTCKYFCDLEQQIKEADGYP
jgi:hypothetical protein